MATTPRNYRRLPGSEAQAYARVRFLVQPMRTRSSASRSCCAVPGWAAGPRPVPLSPNPAFGCPRLSDADFAARHGADPAEYLEGESVRPRTWPDGGGSQSRPTHARHRRHRCAVQQGIRRHAAKSTSTRSERGSAYGKQTETYRGRDGFIHVPADLTEIIVGVFGLDNRRITKRCALPTASLPTLLDMPTVTPQLYDFPSNLAAGQTIAIFSEAGLSLLGDIAANFGGSPPSVIDVPRWTSPNGGFPDLETTQDIFIAASAAPQGAQIAVYFTIFYAAKAGSICSRG